MKEWLVDNFVLKLIALVLAIVTWIYVYDIIK